LEPSIRYRLSDGQSLQLNRASSQINAGVEAIICEQTNLWLQSRRSSIGESHEFDRQHLDKLPPWLAARVRKVAVAERSLLREVLPLRKRFSNMRTLDFQVVFLENKPARSAPVIMPLLRVWPCRPVYIDHEVVKHHLRTKILQLRDRINTLLDLRDIQLTGR
jgi:hypothetical protein